jgi:hypothetical protein
MGKALRRQRVSAYFESDFECRPAILPRHGMMALQSGVREAGEMPALPPQR